MSEGLNRVMILGNLGADPELKQLNGGSAVLKLRIATSETYLDKSNTRQERTEWHSVTVWGKRGEALAKILTKGSRVFVEGSLRTSSYEKDGEKRYRTEINALNVILAGGGKERGESSSTGTRGASTPARTAAPVKEDDVGDAYEGDDIPFISSVHMSCDPNARRARWEKW